MCVCDGNYPLPHLRTGRAATLFTQYWYYFLFFRFFLRNVCLYSLSSGQSPRRPLCIQYLCIATGTLYVLWSIKKKNKTTTKKPKKKTTVNIIDPALHSSRARGGASGNTRDGCVRGVGGFVHVDDCGAAVGGEKSQAARRERSRARGSTFGTRRSAAMAYVSVATSRASPRERRRPRGCLRVHRSASGADGARRSDGHRETQASRRDAIRLAGVARVHRGGRLRHHRRPHGGRRST